MYCPRCGAPNTETTKFCRQCGLALLEVTTYVATGGASSLQSVANTPVVQAGSFTPKQKKILAILASLFVPLASLIFLSETGAPDAIVAPFVFSIPILITLSVMYFNNQAKRLEQAQRSAPSQPLTPPQAYMPPQQQAYLQAPVMPVSTVPASDVPRQTPNTNPLRQPVSIIEDETKRLPS